ncbi:hypothetical protein P175DRAFT_0489682 [Aspergillus ochraceoroseus IBT 24754]|uniref:SAP domain-containing protein n=2 Tax=Aspergillus ochraceoroseus TaxID=138278 RepID=A0A2T5M7Q3_9EURO|nr:uncharacterized protein P175DRAFT_0489682 [Aspergillus ochraceoroseus IBT 24754]KKK17830.1 hypothetical protein AOCH_007557 [Aspergillus ochraceoroseus]PTU24570.1 hypothetical protein P175DRAFT_0489682 [Aspergillus ochraceoroseus IBT 24754]
MATDYSKKTNAELVEILKSRSLPHTGKKADMVARLQEDDTKKDTAPAKTDIGDDVIDWEDDEVPAAKPAEAAAPAQDKPAATKPEEAKVETTEASQEGSEGTVTAAPETTAAPVEEKPAPNYSMGLSVTDMEEELKKRKARAEKFGVTDDSQAAIDDAEKKLERAKRFGAGAEATGNGTAAIGRLDQALPDEKSRKRGRGENDQGARGGKRRNLNGRNNFRHRGRGNRNQGQGPKRSGNATETTGPNWSEKDKAAMEARKKRFGA